MKRDMELVCALLEDIEENCTGSEPYSPPTSRFDGYSKEMVRGHLTLLAERGLIEATRTRVGFAVMRLTWSGHDFGG